MVIDEPKLTLDAAALWKKRVVSAFEAGERTFDFSAVKRADSAALSLVLSLLRRAGERGEAVQLKGLPPQIHSLARVYGVRSILEEAGTKA